MSLKKSLTAAAFLISAHAQAAPPTSAPAPNQQPSDQPVKVAFAIFGSCQPQTNKFLNGTITVLLPAAIGTSHSFALVPLARITVQNLKITASEFSDVGKKLIDPADQSALTQDAKDKGDLFCAARAGVHNQNSDSAPLRL